MPRYKKRQLSVSSRGDGDSPNEKGDRSVKRRRTVCNEDELPKMPTNSGGSVDKPGSKKKKSMLNVECGDNSTTKKKKERGNSKPKRRSKLVDKELYCDVRNIISYRINPCSEKVILEFLVEWASNNETPNTWEKMDHVRYNLSFLDFVHSNFSKYEKEIFVKIANIKEKVKARVRKAYNMYPKFYIMTELVHPFDPIEYKAHQVFLHLLNEIEPKFSAHMDDLVFRSYFFKLDQTHREQASALAAVMSEREKIHILIENDEDWEMPPSFEYITKNFIVDNVDQTIVEDAQPENLVKGCRCTSCTPSSICCPELVNELFAYKQFKDKRIIRLVRHEAIIECNENCRCGPNCLNRVTQQPRNLTLSLFKTSDRGWGVKNADLKSSIKKNTFILEYTGELLGCHEASKRTVHSYLYDMNMERKTDGYYTVDAYKHGNLARFVNHSCEPNASMWYVNDCLNDPKSQKLCIFADRDIEFGEEITIDYCPKREVPTSDIRNYSQSFLCECHCQTKSCRGTIY